MERHHNKKFTRFLPVPISAIVVAAWVLGLTLSTRLALSTADCDNGRCINRSEIIFWRNLIDAQLGLNTEELLSDDNLRRTLHRPALADSRTTLQDRISVLVAKVNRAACVKAVEAQGTPVPERSKTDSFYSLVFPDRVDCDLEACERCYGTSVDGGTKSLAADLIVYRSCFKSLNEGFCEERGRGLMAEGTEQSRRYKQWEALGRSNSQLSLVERLRYRGGEFFEDCPEVFWQPDGEPRVLWKVLTIPPGAELGTIFVLLTTRLASEAAAGPLHETIFSTAAGRELAGAALLAQLRRLPSIVGPPMPEVLTENSRELVGMLDRLWGSSCIQEPEVIDSMKLCRGWTTVLDLLESPDRRTEDLQRLLVSALRRHVTLTDGRLVPSDWPPNRSDLEFYFDGSSWRSAGLPGVVLELSR